MLAQRWTEIITAPKPQDTGLMNKTSGAPQSRTSTFLMIEIGAGTNEATLQQYVQQRQRTKDLLVHIHLSLGTTAKAKTANFDHNPDALTYQACIHPRIAQRPPMLKAQHSHLKSSQSAKSETRCVTRIELYTQTFRIPYAWIVCN